MFIFWFCKNTYFFLIIEIIFLLKGNLYGCNLYCAWCFGPRNPTTGIFLARYRFESFSGGVSFFNCL